MNLKKKYKPRASLIRLIIDIRPKRWHTEFKSQQ